MSHDETPLLTKIRGFRRFEVCAARPTTYLPRWLRRNCLSCGHCDVHFTAETPIRQTHALYQRLFHRRQCRWHIQGGKPDAKNKLAVSDGASSTRQGRPLASRGNSVNTALLAVLAMCIAQRLTRQTFPFAISGRLPSAEVPMTCPRRKPRCLTQSAVSHGTTSPRQGRPLPSRGKCVGTAFLAVIAMCFSQRIAGCFPRPNWTHAHTRLNNYRGTLLLNLRGPPGEAPSSSKQGIPRNTLY